MCLVVVVFVCMCYIMTPGGSFVRALWGLVFCDLIFIFIIFCFPNGDFGVLEIFIMSLTTGVYNSAKRMLLGNSGKELFDALANQSNRGIQAAASVFVNSRAAGGAAIGAGIGAVNGALSDRQSILGGAIGGAAFGATLGAAHGFGMTRHSGYRHAVASALGEGLESGRGIGQQMMTHYQRNANNPNVKIMGGLKDYSKGGHKSAFDAAKGSV